MELEQEVLYHLYTGIVFSAVCAPKSWNTERVSKEANAKLGNPGTSGGKWVITTDNLPNELTANPFPCNDDSERQHWILNC